MKLHLHAALLMAFPPIHAAFWLVNFLRPEAGHHAR